MRHRWLRGLTALFAALALLIGITGALAAPPAQAAGAPRKLVILYGDSISFESSHVIANGFAKKGWAYRVHAYIGLAPCDLLPNLGPELTKFHPKVVVLETMGNDLTKCMTRVTTVRGSKAYLDKYRADIHAFFSRASKASTKVFFMQPLPVLASNYNATLDQITAIAKSEAAKFADVHISNLPRRAVTTSGKFALRMPCLSGETTAQGCDASTHRILVRSPDHLHLCPVTLPSNGCPQYSSGEVRYGRALVAAIAGA